PGPRAGWFAPGPPGPAWPTGGGRGASGPAPTGTAEASPPPGRGRWPSGPCNPPLNQAQEREKTMRAKWRDASHFEKIVYMNWFPGSAWEPPAREALPRGGEVEAGASGECVPRRSLGTSTRVQAPTPSKLLT